MSTSHLRRPQSIQAESTLGRRPPDAPPAREATMREIIHESLATLGNLENHGVQIQGKLFGYAPTGVEENAKVSTEPPLESLLFGLRERLHRLDSHLAGVSERL